MKEKKNYDSGKDDRVAITTSNFFLIYNGDIINLVCHKTSWMTNSGVSIHTISHKDLFTSYTSTNFGYVKISNDSLANIIGIEDMCLKTNNSYDAVEKKLVRSKDVVFMEDQTIKVIKKSNISTPKYNNDFIELDLISPILVST